MISFTNLSILAEESRYFQHVLRIISGIFSWGNNMFSLYQKVTFIKIRQTNPSAPIFFSANAKRASSVEDIIACEYSRLSSLPAPEGRFARETSAIPSQKFHTDDVNLS